MVGMPYRIVLIPCSSSVSIPVRWVCIKEEGFQSILLFTDICVLIITWKDPRSTSCRVTVFDIQHIVIYCTLSKTAHRDTVHYDILYIMIYCTEGRTTDDGRPRDDSSSAVQ